MAKSASLDERADALERKMSDELDVLISKSALFNMDKRGRLTGYRLLLRRAERRSYSS